MNYHNSIHRICIHVRSFQSGASFVFFIRPSSDKHTSSFSFVYIVFALYKHDFTITEILKNLFIIMHSVKCGRQGDDEARSTWRGRQVSIARIVMPQTKWRCLFSAAGSCPTTTTHVARLCGVTTEIKTWK